ncbi:MAG TPA: thioredoxin domain-containing protein [Patescibacteria group bacterium]|nr:thioredoxin domain-containing protein [Patescibacteria group bacterium]
MFKNLSQETKIISGIVLATVVILVVGAVLLGNGSSTSASDTSSSSGSAPKADNSKLITSEAYQSNPKGAQVTLVEFADFECPGCGAMAPVISQLQKEYGKKLNVIYHNFPLPMHQDSKIAAQAAIAAGNQGKFWQMHDLLFANQAKWSVNDNPQSIFDGYAKSLKLDMNKFNQDIVSQAVITRITNDVADGNALNVDSTPTIYINQHQYLGDFSLAGLENVVNTYIKK